MKRVISGLITFAMIISMIQIGVTMACAAQSGDYSYTVTKSKTTIIKYNGAGGAVIIPSTLGGYPVTQIGSRAFDSCGGLISVTIPKSVTSIGSFAFCFCDKLNRVVIPNSIKTIGEAAFRECYELKSITIPGSVTSIGNYAFGYMYVYSDLHTYQPFDDFSLYCTVNSAGQKYAVANGFAYYLFSGDFVYIIQNSKVLITKYRGSANTATVPEKISGYTVTGISKNTFWDYEETAGFPILNKTLLSITIPSSVINIDDLTFHYCISLASINVDSANKVYTSIAGVLYNKAKTKLIQYPAGSNQKVYNIPDSLTSIPIGDSDRGVFNEWCTSFTDFKVRTANKAFSSRDGVLFNKNGTILIKYPSSNTRKSYKIPNGVKKISTYSFDDCRYLQHVIISDSVEMIDPCAFNSCHLVKSILIPKGVNKIGYTAFEGDYHCGNGGWEGIQGFEIYCYQNTEGERYAKEMASGYGIKYHFISTPSVPANVKAARISSTSIKISWASVADATGYVVYRYYSSTKSYQRVKVTTATNYTNTDLKTGVNYYYKVSAYRSVNGTNVYSTPTDKVWAIT